ncbi:AAWKG family protein [Streptomyces sp. NPDC006798]|uniref:AAWKG family protein n=1 Tax=Streptomyces sp. NPDC006798 TaxID=3155462 RepID=UPI003402BDC9
MAENVVYPADSVDDYWHTAVQVLTGYVMPKRETVFGSLVGNDSIPLMRVEFSDHDGEPSNAIVDAVDDLGWRTENSGWRVENTDFVVPFYSGKNGAIAEAPVGTRVKMKKARITLLGTSGTDDPPAGGVVLGGEFKSGLGKDFQGQSKDTVWSNKALAQYSYGGGKALEQLLNRGNTRFFSWNDLPVHDANAVDLDSFNRNAQAFDRVAQFFAGRLKELKDWEYDLGKQEAVWKGQAAGVFKDLVHGLVRTYESYSKQFPVSGTVNSTYGNDLRGFRDDVRTAADKLHGKWDTWQLLTGNPLRWLHDILLDVTDTIWNQNIRKVRYKPSYSSHAYATSAGYHYVKFENFTAAVTPYGKLEEKDTWKKIGEEAIRRWQKSVQDVLSTAGKQALIDVENAFNGQRFPEKVTTVSINLSNQLAKDQAARDRAEAAKAKADADEKLRLAKEEADRKEREAAERERLAREEAERKQREAEERARRAQEEAERRQREAEARAEQRQRDAERRAEEKQREAEARQAEKEAEQERKQEEKEREAEAKQAEAERKQEQKEAEQKAKQAEAEAKQEQKQAEQEAKQADAERRAEERQAEQEAKQEQKEKEAQDRQILLTNQARADQRRQREEQERKQAEAEAKQEQKEAEQERKQEEKEREAEAERAEAERKQEEKQAEQERKQEEREAEQERKQAEAEQQRIRTESEYKADQQEQRREAEERRAEAEAKQERKEAEAEARQEELRTEQERKQAEAEAKQERKEAEQLSRQEQLRAEQEQRQAEAEAKQERKEAEARERAERQSRDLGRDVDHGPGGQGRGGADVPIPDGLRLPDGSGSGTITLNPDGSVTTEYRDGSTRTIDLPGGEVVTTRPDGSTVVDTLRPGDAITDPDGGVTRLGADGTLTTSLPDGSRSVLDPDRGTLVSDLPDGTRVTTPIDPGETLPTGLGGGTALPGGGALYSSDYSGGYEEELYDREPGSGSGGGADYGLGSGNGAGMGMPMLPMGTRINGGTTGGGAEGERVRGVVDDGRPVTTRHGQGGGRDDVSAAARGSLATASGGMPYLPPAGGAAGQPTESGDRERASWLDEDEDVWGTDEGGAPAVLGR